MKNYKLKGSSLPDKTVSNQIDLVAKGSSPYSFEPEVPLVASQIIKGINPIQVKAISIHHPLLFTSCNLRTVTHREGKSVPSVTTLETIPVSPKSVPKTAESTDPDIIDSTTRKSWKYQNSEREALPLPSTYLRKHVPILSVKLIIKCC